MDFPIHIDTISMDLSILHFKRSQLEISKFQYISVLKIFFIFANIGADPVFTVCQSTCLQVSRIEKTYAVSDPALSLKWGKSQG